jgi:hypothetical protein
MRIGKRGRARLSYIEAHAGSAKMVKGELADMIPPTHSGTAHLTI